MNFVYLSLGTNLGEKEKNILEAECRISDLIGGILKSSSIYNSKAQGFESDFDFLNKVIFIETKLKPFELLDKIEEIEFAMGRKEKSVDKHYRDRIIDIDILYFNEETIETERLIIPHPEIYKRDFVYVPLSEIIEKKPN
jgi:2-amino-4-hydroxy-6-hydroxymethyldihydropteridine diphosphokinase